jgi:preprotein translocase subunit SecD
MQSLNQVLRETDPLRHEGLRLDIERERLRQTILHAVRLERAPSPQRGRLTLTTVLAVATVGMVALGVTLWVRTMPLVAAVRFEVRLAEVRPVPGLTVASAGDSEDLIYLHPEVIVSNEDIAQSWVQQDGPDRFGVEVRLLPEGAERLRQATEGHVGRPVAILIDGSVVALPVVRSPISDSALISVYTQAEAERIAAGIVP